MRVERQCKICVLRTRGALLRKATGKLDSLLETLVFHRGECHVVLPGGKGRPIPAPTNTPMKIPTESPISLSRFIIFPGCSRGGLQQILDSLLDSVQFIV